MCTVRFIADLHLGHVNMAKHRGFQDEFYHDEHIVDQWNSVVDKRDLTYILGDVTMENSKNYYRLDSMNGRKIVVLGNHDRPQDIPELLKSVDKVSGMVNYKGIWLTHCPVHESELEYRVNKNIHGHIHEKVVMKNVYEWGYKKDPIPDERYICVSCEHVGYKPKTLEELGITR
jgi:calcineurin-like phosphoesterase family protein